MSFNSNLLVEKLGYSVPELENHFGASFFGMRTVALKLRTFSLVT